MVERHERLKIWQKSYDLPRDLMAITERFPRPQQINGLGSEIRQAALNLIQTVMIANSGPGTAANRDLDLGCQIAARHPSLRVAFDPIEVTV